MELHNLSTQQQKKQTHIKNTILSKPMVRYNHFHSLHSSNNEFFRKVHKKEKKTYQMEIKRKEKKKVFIDRKFFV